MFTRVFLVALILAAVGCGGGGGIQNPTYAAISFQSIDKSQYSGVTAPDNLVIKDAVAWAQLWAQHTNGVAPMPTVDFNIDMVLAVFLGNRPSGCYSVEITSVVEDSTGITVNYHEAVPTGSSVVCTASITHPSHMVVVPASTAQVRFVAV